MTYTTTPLRGLPTVVAALLLAVCLAPALSAQTLLTEDFDALAGTSPPAGWDSGGDTFTGTTADQACMGNAFRMNVYDGQQSAFLETPLLDRGDVAGSVNISFTVRLADFGNNNIMNGTGSVFAQLFLGTSFSQDFFGLGLVDPVDCQTFTFDLDPGDIPLDTDFKIRFLASRTSGDWVYVIDDVDIRIVNDECVTAWELPQTTVPAGILDGNVVDASFEGATQTQAACTGTANDDVWFSFEAVASSVALSVQAGDVVVELFSGTCGNLVSLECIDKSTVNEFASYHGTTIGETYFVRVYSFAGTELTGTDAEFRIQIGTPEAQNDECVSATTLTQSSATTCGTNLTMGSVEGATQSQAACTGTANDDVWYQFEATASEISVFLESDDYVMQLFAGNCGSLVSLGCEDAQTTNEVLTYSGATVGDTYFLRVYSFASADLTDEDAEFGICVFTTPPVPDNNDPEDADNLPVGLSEVCGGSTSGTTNGGSWNSALTRCSGINGQTSVWYSFEAAGDQQIITLSSVEILNGSDGPASSFEVFSLDGGSNPVSQQCSGQLFGTDPGGITIAGLTSGETYLVRVIPVNPTQTIDFDICVNTPCPDPPSNLQVQDIMGTTAVLSHSYPLLYPRTFRVVTATSGLTTYSENSLQGITQATGLSPQTDYEYYVGIDCQGFTETVGPVTFTTCADPAMGLTVDMITSTGAQLNVVDDGGLERDYVVVPAGQTPVYGGGGTFFSSSSDGFSPATGLTPATAYDFYVGQACPETFAGPVSFTTSLAAPDNDDCSGATSLGFVTNRSCVTGENEVTGTLAGATDSGISGCDAAGFVGDANDDVWYTFQSQSNYFTVNVATTENTDIVVELFTGDCNNLTSLRCEDSFATSPENFTFDQAVPTQQYWVRIYSYRSAALAGNAAEFTLCVTESEPNCGETITDDGGPGNYSINLDQVITLCPRAFDDDQVHRVNVSFSEFDFETDGGSGCIDGITLYDGPDTTSPVIPSPSGSTNQWCWNRAAGTGSGDLLNTTIFNTNTTGCLTLRIQSDGSNSGTGFAMAVDCGATGDILTEILQAVPAGTGAVTADRAIMSATSGFTYYVDDGSGGTLLGLDLRGTEAIVPISGVTMVAGNTASNLGLNGCMAPYTNQTDWYVSGRTWDVAATQQPTSPVAIRLNYSDEDLQTLITASGFTGATHEDLTHFKINGGDEEDLTAAGNACHDLVAPANYQEFDPGEYQVIDFGGPAGTKVASYEVNEFSGGGFGLGTAFAGALPIELFSFTGYAEPKRNRLEWISSREENTSRHRIERSVGGRNWSEIGGLTAAGNSNVARHYDFYDREPLPFAFYRIITEDLDGSTSVSEMVQISREAFAVGLTLGSITPQPAHSEAIVNISVAPESGPVSLRLLDAMGRTLRSLHPAVDNGWNRIRINLGDLPAGTYWLRVSDAAGNEAVKPLVKQ